MFNETDHGEFAAQGGRRDRPGASRGGSRASEGRSGDSGGGQRSGSGTSGGGPRGASGALIALDKELMKLLVRRATLVSRIREGRDQAVTPAAVRAEKEVRLAWEAGAVDFSRDPVFARQLFNLLQDIKVLNREQARNAGVFTLQPPRGPVSGVLSGPADIRAATMRILAASCLGSSLRLEKLLPAPALIDTVKSCARAGVAAACEYTGDGFASVKVDPGPALAPGGRTLFVGDDSLTAHIMIFTALKQSGILRLNGGGRLKAADLSALRRTLPLFGARMAHVVPHSRGLPAVLECSGALPAQVDVPADLPLDALSALLFAPPFWNVPIRINLAAVPALTAAHALAEVRPLHETLGADAETAGMCLEYRPASLSLPEKVAVPLDPVLSAFLLSLPFFAGGAVTLEGEWPEQMPPALEALRMLNHAGLELERDVACIRARASGKPSAFRAWSEGLSCGPSRGPAPLFLAMCAAGPKAAKGDAEFALRLFEGEEQEQAGEFLSRAGVSGGVAAAHASGRSGIDNSPAAWTCPDAYWGMAYALAAFAGPGLRLANPGTVSEVMPTFWKLFNNLPELKDPLPVSVPAKDTLSVSAPAHEEAAQPQAGRRRIRA
jgi:5-enolpyruvylshikimate-3-phosphate synthase